MQPPFVLARILFVIKQAYEHRDTRRAAFVVIPLSFHPPSHPF